MTENGGASRDGATKAIGGQPRRSAKREVPRALRSGGSGVRGAGSRTSNVDKPGPSSPSLSPRGVIANVRQSMKDPSVTFGKEFNSKLTGGGYGIFRKCGGALPSDFSITKFGTPFAEDGSGNLFTQTQNGSICFWDHETDDLTVIASSWEEFASGCVEPKAVKLKPGQVKSAWMNPEFAKKMGIEVPKDGWIKKKS
jgi:hypothetical protein